MDLPLSAPPDLLDAAPPQTTIDGKMDTVIVGLARAVESLGAEIASLDFHKQSARDLQKTADSFLAVAKSSSNELQQQTGLPIAFAVPTEEAHSMIIEATREVQRIRNQGLISRKRHYAKDKDNMRAFADALHVLEGFLAFDTSSPSSFRHNEDPHQAIVRQQQPMQRDFIPISTAFDGFKATLLGLINMADGLPWPLKAVPQTIAQLISQAEAFTSLHDQYVELIDRSILLYRAMTGLFFKSHALSPVLEQQVTAFFSHFQLLVLRIRVIESVNKVRQFISATRIDAYLKAESTRVNEILAEITAVFTVDTNVTIRLNESVAEKRHNQLVGLIEGTPVTGTISESSVPPPQPDVFYGRQTSVATLINYLDSASSSHVAILGAGGIGKTSVALAVLHEPRTVARFGARRYFLTCEGMRQADSVALKFARIVGGKRDGAERDPLAAIRDGLVEPTVLVIDNLESIWVTSDVKTRQDTERLLRTLGSMNNLSLIVTSRGSIPPPGVKWANARDPTLDTLSVEAALSIFSDVAGEINASNEETHAMEQLVNEVDCMPLAVSLLAQLARNGESPRSLLRQWEKKRSRLLQTEATGREYNVEVSIAITLDFLPPIEVDPEPIRLLAICSDLPAGLFPKAMESLQGPFDDVDAAARLLRKHALVHTGTNGQLKMLSPVRHFVKTRHTVTDVHRATLLDYHCKLARDANQPIDTSFPEVSRLVAPELGNVAWILHAAIDATAGLTSTIIEGVLDYSWYTYHTIPATELLESLIVRLRRTPGGKRDLGRGLRLCGDMCRMRFRHDDAETYLNEASAVFASIEDLWGHAECSMCLGLVYISGLRYSEAEKAFKIAMDGFVLSSDELSIAQCEKSMADLAAAGGDDEMALKLLNSASERFAKVGHGRGVALCDKNIGIAALKVGDSRSALKTLDAARMTLEEMGDIHGLAQCNEAIAEAHVAEGKFGEATIALERARALLVMSGERVHSERLGKTVQVITECVDSSSGVGWERVRADIWQRRPPKWYRVPQLSDQKTSRQILDNGLNRSPEHRPVYDLGHDDDLSDALATTDYSAITSPKAAQRFPPAQAQPPLIDPGLHWTRHRRDFSISTFGPGDYEEEENNPAPVPGER